MTTVRSVAIVAGLALALCVATLVGQEPRPTTPDAVRFKSGIDLINVTATVTDATGRFVSGLRKEDFSVFEDDQPVEVTYFSPERVPVSLGILLDTSGSMAGERIREAQAALDRFLFELLARDDEVFLYRFSTYPDLLQTWTTDRGAVSRALGHVVPNGGTAMYDAIADALPLAQKGQNPKKALLVISDGNDTASRTRLSVVKQMVRESEVLVYAIGVDSDDEQPVFRQPAPQPPRIPIPWPFPPIRGRGRFPQVFGGQPAGGGALPQIFGGGQGGGGGSQSRASRSFDHVNVGALHELTDDSGGRTEIVRLPRDLNPSTANIADELSKQYYLGYPASGKKDGRWHSIRVEVASTTYHVRARRGYAAN